MTFPRKPVRGFSLIGELGAEVFVLLRRHLLHKHYQDHALGNGTMHFDFLMFIIFIMFLFIFIMLIIIDFYEIGEDGDVDEVDHEEADGEGGE